MSVDDGFNSLQSEADATIEAVREARRRRDAFRTALPTAADVHKVVPSGSLARGTHKDPIHDVDLVCVFHASQHPSWGQPGTSAREALEHTRGLIKDKLGFNGTEGREVRRCDLRNHSVKCFLDDPNTPGAFTVDVTPALVHPDRGFLIPEQNRSKWIQSDPEHLIRMVAKRHEDWNQFAKLVRVLKRWNADHGGHMKSLTVEVLALRHLPVGDRPNSIARFFEAAAEAVWLPVEDPAGLCGEIQPDLDRLAASTALEAAADAAAKAIDAAARGQQQRAMCYWRTAFGAIFPEPPGGCNFSTVTKANERRPIEDSPQGCRG